MKKETIEIYRQKGWMDNSGGFWNDRVVMEKILEWSIAPENKNKFIYRHVCRTAHENVDYTKTYSKVYEKISMDIPMCDIVEYVDIYWQENLMVADAESQRTVCETVELGALPNAASNL